MNTQLLLRQGAAVLFLFSLSLFFSYTEKWSDPCFHSTPNFLKKSSTGAQIFCAWCQPEVNCSRMFKSSQLILSMKDRGQKGILDLKNGFILLSPSSSKQQHSLSQMIHTPSASSCGKMSQLDGCSDRPQLRPL